MRAGNYEKTREHGPGDLHVVKFSIRGRKIVKRKSIFHWQHAACGRAGTKEMFSFPSQHSPAFVLTNNSSATFQPSTRKKNHAQKTREGGFG
jgi:hypothetical protein